MSKICQITKKSVMSGNNVSHAHNRTKRLFEPNLHNHRFWSENQKKWITLKLSKKGLRIIDKLGLDKALEKYKVK
ncbi:MAG: 50S ribosomal protein L28 [Gammaproteobacteria bacterium]|nr:50S ribosomal protein L28 [Gammaproteobacteria bacterium]|tara:strand:+ start:887 stop:1111 length:225 start_codon:yes stop_codon:yes gene_type:complete